MTNLRKHLSLHGFSSNSKANGPGQRAVIWLQGCSIRCPGCFNTGTHDFNEGTLVEVEELFRRIMDIGITIEGITVSGGEPLDQRGPLLDLLKQIREKTDLSTILFTGYSWDEIQHFPEASDLLSCIDVIIAGRFEAVKRIAVGMIGSANKTFHLLTDRYEINDFFDVPVAEIMVSPDGIVSITGIDPPLIKDEKGFFNVKG
jgi:anaerobic ribonucleoside-triphosphate reductase activating protein